MFRYILKSIKKYYEYFIFMVLGIFVIMTIFPLGVSSLLKIKVAVQGDITKYGRGEYDLLVRNEESISKVEKELNLIDESYAANGKGGISMQQYEDIKKINGIEVAAPISNLGYYIGSAQFLSIITNAEEANKISLTYYTWDGPNKYKIEEANSYQIPGNKYVGVNGQKNEEIESLDNTYKYMPYAIGNGVCSVDGYIENNNKNLKVSTFMLPKSFSMLVAIDVEEENKIFNPKIAISPGSLLKNKKVEEIKNVKDYFTEKMHNKVNKIPIVTNNQSPLRLEASVNIKKLNASEKVLRDMIVNSGLGKYPAIDLKYANKEDREKVTKLISDIEKFTDDKEELKGYVNLNKEIIPFLPINNIMCKAYENNFKVKENQSPNANIVLSNAHYTVDDFVYQGSKSILVPKALKQNNGVLIFSDKVKKGLSNEEFFSENSKEIPIIFDFVAEAELVDRASLEYDPKFNGSPLGIYGGDSIVQLEDNNGKKVNRFIDQTIELGSLGKVMPNAYTTIDAAPILKGDKPIDAIRVKIDGISEYNKSSKDKIEKIATEIHNKTGLRVDFVAGSSTTKTVAQIDGIDGANGLGKIEKRWVTLGTESLVTANWNTSAFVLMIAFIGCGCLFVINRINSYMILRKGEMTTLKCTGWDKKYIALVVTGENILAYFVATIFSVLVLIKFHIDKTLLLLSISIIFAIIILVSYIYTFNHKSKLKKRGYKSASFSMLKLIVADISRNKNRYILLMIQLILTATLGLFTFMSFIATSKSIEHTALGSQVNMSTNSIVKPIIIGSIILIIFTTFDRFTSLMLERRKEITLLKTLGWSKCKIARLMYGSLIIIGILVTVITLIISGAIGIILYKTILLDRIYMVGISLIILLVCIIGGIYPIIKTLNKTVLKYDNNR